MSSLTRNRNFLAGLVAAGLAALLVSGGALWMLTRPGPPAPWTPTPTLRAPINVQLTPAPSLEDLATRYPQLGSLLRDPALDSVYKDFLLAYETGGLQAARELALQRGLLNAQDEVRITLVIDSPDNTPGVANELDKFGVIVEGAYRDLIDIAVPMTLVERFAQTEEPAKLFDQLTQLEHIVKLRLPAPARIDGRSLAPQGPGVTGAAAWHAAGLTGQGVKVGVLDLGFDGYKNLLGAELPEQVTAKSFVRGQEPDASGQVHGTACAEIIHAMAPDAELYLAYYNGGEVGLGRAVEWLLEQDVRVISHSATGLVAPMDGTGSQARLVDEATARGVVWVNAMGNYADAHYRGAFTDTDGNYRHEFPNGEVMAYRPPRHDAIIVLNWDEWPASRSDLDLFLYDEQSNLVAASQNAQNGQTGDQPFEFIRLAQPDMQTYYIVVQAKSAISAALTLDVYAPDGQIEFPSAPYSLGTPADAKTALSVGAVDWRSNTLEPFSSQGPTYDDRLKPELAGPDQVTTASYAPKAFPGTSAATPHVAGAAALVLGAFPAFTPQQVVDYLAAHAVDLGPGGPDAAYGYGGVRLPEPAANQAPAPVAPPPTPVAAAPAPITPLPPARVQAGNNASVAVLACLGAFMCLGALGVVGGGALLLGLSRPARQATRPPVAPAQARPAATQACLVTGDGASIFLNVGETTVGRARENAIALASDNQVSRHHAVIAWDGRACAITDLNSSNGTFVNGERLAPHSPHLLHSGDRVRFGLQAKFVVRLPEQRQ